MVKRTNGTTEVTRRQDYEVFIRGTGNGILFNKAPDLSITKAEKKEQAKIDPVEMERLHWKEKAYESGGRLYIPGENLHECLKEGAKYWGMKIPGEGNKTYTDVVASAIVVEDLDLQADLDSLVPFGKAVNGNPSKGKKSGCKVYKIRPLLQPWSGKFTLHVLDGRLSVDILETIITFAGQYKGLCDWRPVYGRFELEDLKPV